jgi:hypothetical protein
MSAILAFLCIGVLTIYGFTTSYGWDVMALSFLVGLASFYVAGLVGYLFGIPSETARVVVRSRTSGPAASTLDPDVPVPEGDAVTDESTAGYLRGNSYSANDSLVEVSQWLTKIILGAGLVQIRSIGNFIASLGKSISETVHLPPMQFAFSSLILVEGTLGFLFFYLWSRVYMPHLFSLANVAAKKQRERELTERPSSPGTP